MKQVIIDTDPGIDDLAALLLALNSPELKVVAITTIYGNASVGVCTANALQILAAAGRQDIPVFKGAGKPLLRPANEGWASHIHGSDGLGGAAESLQEEAASDLRAEDVSGALPAVSSGYAATVIIEKVMAAPGEVSILALGRLTNVALGLAIEPRVAEAAREIVVMGGAVTVPGNVSPVATANLHEDPEAAAMVYDSGARIVQVGLDVCNRVTISLEQLATLARSSNPGVRLLVNATECLRESYIRTGRIGPGEGVRYNDLPAVAYAVNPELFKTRPASVQIATVSELTRGQTIANWDADNPNALVCLEVDGESVAAMFAERLGNLG